MTYSRLQNPTVAMLEERIALLEGAEACRAQASGMAAMTAALLCQLSVGDHVVGARAAFGSCRWLLDHLCPRFGIEVSVIDSTDNAAWEAAIRPNTKVFFFETPANPTMQLHRIRTAADWARQHETEAHRIIVSVDNTYLGPILQRPLEHGADVLLYSATKYIGGHSDLIAGAASGVSDAMARIREYRNFLGGMANPNTCWMLLRSMETLAIRVHHQQAVAEQVFAHLRHHPAIMRFNSAWPADLPESDRVIASEQMIGGGAMAAFEVAGGRAAAFRVLNALKHFQLAVSLGSTESLAEHPASMTHAGVPAEVKAAFGITEGLIRISVGIERPEDLIADLDQALAKI